MKKLLFLVAMVAVFASCEKNKMESYDWEGVYTVETTGEIVYTDESREVMRDPVQPNPVVFSSEMTIYKRGGTLYAQTQYFGTPDTTLRGVYYCINAPQRRMPMNSTEEDGLEPVIVSYQPTIFMANGMVYIKHENKVYTAPVPAKAKSSSPNTLTFYPSQPFDVAMIPSGFNSNYTELDPAHFDMINCQYVFGDMQKTGNEITWDITLNFHYPVDWGYGPAASCIIYHNKVTKK